MSSNFPIETKEIYIASDLSQWISYLLAEISKLWTQMHFSRMSIHVNQIGTSVILLNVDAMHIDCSLNYAHLRNEIHTKVFPDKIK